MDIKKYIVLILLILHLISCSSSEQEDRKGVTNLNFIFKPAIDPQAGPNAIACFLATCDVSGAYSVPLRYGKGIRRGLRDEAHEVIVMQDPIFCPAMNTAYSYEVKKTIAFYYVVCRSADAFKTPEETPWRAFKVSMETCPRDSEGRLIVTDEMMFNGNVDIKGSEFSAIINALGDSIKKYQEIRNKEP